jgi:hypothetical protein
LHPARGAALLFESIVVSLPLRAHAGVVGCRCIIYVDYIRSSPREASGILPSSVVRAGPSSWLPSSSEEPTASVADALCEHEEQLHLADEAERGLFEEQRLHAEVVDVLLSFLEQFGAQASRPC